MRIDVAEILRKRAPRLSRRIPSPLIRMLADYIRQDRINDILERHSDLEGVDFADAALADLGVSYEVSGIGNLPESPRVIFASNHPLGGLDGLVLTSMASRIYGGRKDVKFVVNDLLTFLEPLRPVFLGVNKHGTQSREAVERLEEAFASDSPMLMFPAGLCSRMGADGRIADLPWNKMIVNKAISCQRDIIPVHFSGENSQFFYKFAKLRSRLGIKFNIEMLSLPREMFRQTGATFRVTIGKPIEWQSLKGGKDAMDEAASLRRTVYNLMS